MKKYLFIALILTALFCGCENKTKKAYGDMLTQLAYEQIAQADSLIAVVSAWNKANPTNPFAIEKGGLNGYDEIVNGVVGIKATLKLAVDSYGKDDERHWYDSLNDEEQKLINWIVKTDTAFHQHIGDYEEWCATRKKAWDDAAAAEKKANEFIP